MVFAVLEESLRIIVPLEDIDTQEKKTVSFSCKVNRPNATLRWLKGGQEVNLNKHIVYRVDKDKHTLTIKDCSLSDEGEYTAVAGDSKSTAELIISEAPTDFSVQLKDQTITEFEDAEFSCKLTKEKADIKWYRNGREIREGPRYVSGDTSRFLSNHTQTSILDCSGAALYTYLQKAAPINPLFANFLLKRISLLYILSFVLS